MKCCKFNDYKKRTISGGAKCSGRDIMRKYDYFQFNMYNKKLFCYSSRSRGRWLHVMFMSKLGLCSVIQRTSKNIPQLKYPKSLLEK